MLAGKRILLIDVDSKIPNLALMKLSAWHKELGDNVALLRGSQIVLTDKPDKVYVSIVFKKNAHALDHLSSAYPDIDIDIGGSGYDLKKELPSEISTSPTDLNSQQDFISLFHFYLNWVLNFDFLFHNVSSRLELAG